MSREVVLAAAGTAVLCLAAFGWWLQTKRGEPVDNPTLGGSGSDPTPAEKETQPVLHRAPVPPGKPSMEQTVFELPTRVTFFGEDEFSPCFLDQEKKILYRWKGVVLRREQLLDTPYGTVPSGIRVLEPEDFTVKSVEAPVRYREVDGGYRVGYLDRTILMFYEWKGVVLTKDELLDKSQDGKEPVVKPEFASQAPPKVIEIEMPAFLKNKPQLWKKQ